MNFGNLAVNNLSGTVVLSPTGSRLPTGGVTLPSVVGTVTAATFTISGVPNYTYSILLPLTDITIYNGPTYFMIVNLFTSDPTPAGTLDPTGVQILKVGATLNVNPSQATGIYITNTPFSVTVNYN